jgi:hypothetical protein
VSPKIDYVQNDIESKKNYLRKKLLDVKTPPSRPFDSQGRVFFSPIPGQRGRFSQLAPAQKVDKTAAAGREHKQRIAATARTSLDDAKESMKQSVKPYKQLEQGFHNQLQEMIKLKPCQYPKFVE